MPEQLTNWDYQWSQVVGQAWANDAFRRRLLANPATTLRECGLEMPAGLEIRVLENTTEVPENTLDLVHLVLPTRPSAEDLSEEELLGGAVGHAVTPCGCYHCGCHHCWDCYRCERCGCERAS